MASETVFLKPANGDKFPFVAAEELEFKNGDLKTKHKTFITAIMDDCILGVEFLWGNNCKLDLTDNVLKIGEEAIEMVCNRIQFEEDEIVAPRNFTIPSFSEHVSISVGNVDDQTTYVLEPEKSLTWNKLIVVERVLARSSKTLMRILNVSEKSVKIKSTLLIHLQPVSSLRKVDASAGNVLEKERLEAIEDLLKNSGNATSKEKKVIRKFLKEFLDVFALHGGDFGRTQLVKHKIDPRRISFSRIDEVHELVNEMQNRGIIEPLTSPGASSVVLVKKERRFHEILCGLHKD